MPISTFASRLRKAVCVTSEMERPQTCKFLTVSIAVQTKSLKCPVLN